MYISLSLALEERELLLVFISFLIVWFFFSLGWGWGGGGDIVGFSFFFVCLAFYLFVWGCLVCCFFFSTPTYGLS